MNPSSLIADLFLAQFRQGTVQLQGREAQLTWALRLGLAHWLQRLAEDADRYPAIASAALAAGMQKKIQQKALAQLLADCNTLGMRPVLLKGALSSNLHYARPDERPMGDIDILLPAHDADRLHGVLLQQGFSQGSDMPAAFYAEHQHRMPYFSVDQHICIEVHTALFRSDAYPGPDNVLQTEAVWQHIESAGEILGQPAWRLSPSWHLAHSACHWSLSTGPATQIFGLADIMFSLRLDRIDYWQLRALAGAPGTRWSLALALHQLEQLVPGDLPAESKPFLTLRHPVARAARWSLKRLYSRRIVHGGAAADDHDLDRVYWLAMIETGGRLGAMPRLVLQLLFPPGHSRRFSPGLLAQRLFRWLSRLLKRSV